MSLSVSRTMWRQAARVGRSARRFESTTTKAAEATKETAAKAQGAAKETAAKAQETAKEAASKASDKASEFKSKASEGLSKVTSSAGPAISNAAASASNALNKIGGRTGALIGFVQQQIPPAIYYAKVGGELAKLVFKGQKMSPPPVSTFQAYFQRAIKGIRNPQSLVPSGASETAQKVAQNPQTITEQVRGLSNAQIASGAVLVAELLGFFTVGEMIGRFKLIGYRGDTGAEHH